MVILRSVMSMVMLMGVTFPNKYTSSSNNKELNSHLVLIYCKLPTRRKKYYNKLVTQDTMICVCLCTGYSGYNNLYLCIGYSGYNDLCLCTGYSGYNDLYLCTGYSGYNDLYPVLDTQDTMICIFYWILRIQ